jgi:hypothetical protein
MGGTLRMCGPRAYLLAIGDMSPKGSSVKACNLKGENTCLIFLRC